MDKLILDKIDDYIINPQNLDNVYKYFTDSTIIENLLFPPNISTIYIVFCIIKNDPSQYIYSYDNFIRIKDKGYGKLVMNINNKFIHLSDNGLVIINDSNYEKLLSIHFASVKYISFCSISNSDFIRSSIVKSIIDINYKFKKSNDTIHLINTIFRNISKDINPNISCKLQYYLKYLSQKNNSDPFLCIVDNKINIEYIITENDIDIMMCTGNYMINDQYNCMVFLRAEFAKKYVQSYYNTYFLSKGDYYLDLHGLDYKGSNCTSDNEIYINENIICHEEISVPFIEISLFGRVIKYLNCINCSTQINDTIKHVVQIINNFYTSTSDNIVHPYNMKGHIKKNLSINDMYVLNNTINIFCYDPHIVILILLCLKFNKKKLPKYICKLILSFF